MAGFSFHFLTVFWRADIFNFDELEYINFIKWIIFWMTPLKIYWLIQGHKNFLLCSTYKIYSLQSICLSDLVFIYVWDRDQFSFLFFNEGTNVSAPFVEKTISQDSLKSLWNLCQKSLILYMQLYSWALYFVTLIYGSVLS